MRNEITIRDIAGFCPEEAVWKMMVDVGELLLKDGSAMTLNPSSIMVDGNQFFVGAVPEDAQEFLAPEQEKGKPATSRQMVWQLGAIAYMAATGHVVFGGHGGAYQREHPHVVLPALPKSLKALTPVIQDCLRYHPSERISMDELRERAEKGLAACSQRQRVKMVQASKARQTENHRKDNWPEEMIEL